MKSNWEKLKYSWIEPAKIASFLILLSRDGHDFFLNEWNIFERTNFFVKRNGSFREKKLSFLKRNEKKNEQKPNTTTNDWKSLEQSWNFFSFLLKERIFQQNLKKRLCFTERTNFLEQTFDKRLYFTCTCAYMYIGLNIKN